MIVRILICLALLWQPPEPTKIPVPYPRYQVYLAIVQTTGEAIR